MSPEKGRLPTLERLEAGKRIQGDQRKKIQRDLAQWYKRGHGIRDLAERIGRSYGFVYRMLVEAEVTLRLRGGQYGERPQKAP
jgi:transposase